MSVTNAGWVWDSIGHRPSELSMLARWLVKVSGKNLFLPLLEPSQNPLAFVLEYSLEGNRFIKINSILHKEPLKISRPSLFILCFSSPGLHATKIFLIITIGISSTADILALCGLLSTFYPFLHLSIVSPSAHIITSTFHFSPEWHGEDINSLVPPCFSISHPSCHPSSSVLNLLLFHTLSSSYPLPSFHVLSSSYPKPLCILPSCSDRRPLFHLRSST